MGRDDDGGIGAFTTWSWIGVMDCVYVASQRIGRGGGITTGGDSTVVGAQRCCARTRLQWGVVLARVRLVRQLCARTRLQWGVVLARQRMGRRAGLGAAMPGRGDDEGAATMGAQRQCRGVATMGGGNDGAR